MSKTLLVRPNWSRSSVTSHAFSLVELMVVVTLIVILIAMLAPALEKAMREAEMAVCGTRQKVIISAGMTYAADHKRSYPRPPIDRQAHTDADGDLLWLETTTSGYQPDLIGFGADPSRDIRPLYEPYMSFEAYGCPLAAGIKFDYESNAPGMAVFANYSIFMGWQYSQFDHFSQQTGDAIVDQRATWKGMYRFGDRLGFFDNWQNRPVESDVVVMDRNHSHSGDSGATVDGGQSAHPDDAGLWPLLVWNNDPNIGITHTVYGYGYRGTLDVNAGHFDNSVRRTNDAAPINGSTSIDDRFGYAPAHADSNTTGAVRYKLMIPR